MSGDAALVPHSVIQPPAPYVSYSATPGLHPDSDEMSLSVR
jgi:hypothetical protein